MVSIVLGNPAPIAVSFTDDGEPADPDEVRLFVLAPSGASVEYVLGEDAIIVHNDTGEFSAELEPDEVGVWRWRFTGTGDAGAVHEGDFEITSVFEPATYATLARTLAAFSTVPKERVQYRLAQALRTATDELTTELSGRDFFRHPGVGDGEFVLDDVDGRVLHVHQGIASVTTLEIRRGSGYTELDPDQYTLRGPTPFSQQAPGEPAFHVVLTSGTWGAGGRLTGALGWPQVPDALAAGCAARARQLVYADPSYEGQIPSDEQYGVLSVANRWPDVTWRFLQRESRRFYACLFEPAVAS
jgi:hypothetical protein